MSTASPTRDDIPRASASAADPVIPRRIQGARIGIVHGERGQIMLGRKKDLTMGAAVAIVAVTLLMVHSGTLDAARGTYSRGPASGTHALFGLDSPEQGPFPSDLFTVPDHTNKTHRRVSLPPPDCEQRVSDCQDLAVLNELDGFNLRPRLSVPFNGPIDPATVTSDTIFLVSLGIVGPGQDYMPWGTMAGVDQVVWDPETNTLHVESDQLLAQHTRFALIVTREIRDQNGTAIEASDAFRRFRADVREDYKQDLLDALHAARAVGVSERDIAVASVFTTQSATAVLERIRDQIHEAAPASADFLLGPGGTRTVFSFDDVTNITWSDGQFGLSLIRDYFLAGTVGVVAFGKYESPDYLVHPEQYIPPVGTRTGVPVVRGTSEIYFNLFLPSGPTPEGGWPVAIVGHGINRSKNDATRLVGSMASHGIATIAINMVGHGLGADGTLTVDRASGSVAFPAGGRGFDQNGDGQIGTNEGSSASGDRTIVFSSDAFRQTAADLMQLVRVIGAGMDVDGDGRPDLDSSRISYFGSSWGAALGAVFAAVEPDVRVVALTVPADSIPIGLLGNSRTAVGAILQTRQPSLLNSPGITNFGGLTVVANIFDDNMPLRRQVPLTVRLSDSTQRLIQSPVTNTVAGAMGIQEMGERYEWVGEAGSPAAYAPHLRRAPLAGVSPKSVLLLIAKGDQTAPNPTTTAILRAGDLADRTLWYRHDLYYASCGSATVRNPHTFAVALDNAFFNPLARAAQDMTGRFFASGGELATVTDPRHFVVTCSVELPPLFEFPVPLPLLKEFEELNFVK